MKFRVNDKLTWEQAEEIAPGCSAEYDRDVGDLLPDGTLAFINMTYRLIEVRTSHCQESIDNPGSRLSRTCECWFYDPTDHVWVKLKKYGAYKRGA